MDYMPQTKDRITPKDKAIFTGIIIILIVAIAVIINLHYYNSIRDSLMSVDFLITSAISDCVYDKNLILTVSNWRGSYAYTEKDLCHDSKRFIVDDDDNTAIGEKHSIIQCK